MGLCADDGVLQVLLWTVAKRILAARERGVSSVQQLGAEERALAST